MHDSVLGGGEMPHGLRRRFWAESISGTLTGALAILTIFWHDWIEAIFGVDPDKGNGTAEWLAVVILFAVTLVLAAVARIEWRRARLAAA